MARPVRILCYAINGTGVGHLSRLAAIAREARELAAVIGTRLDIQFVTTSEAPQIAHGFPVYKLPSKTIVNASDTNVDRFRRSAKLIVANLAATLQPDLLVLDTVPEGSYREFVFLREYARACIFIDRHKDRPQADDATHRSHLSLYDRILVPDVEARAEDYPLPEQLASRRRFLGPVHGYRVDQALSGAEARAELSVPAGHRLAYLSAGGGGDALAAAQIRTCLEALSTLDDTHVIVGYGPLFRGHKHYSPRVTPFIEAGVQRFFGALDFAISAAGYNSYEELLAAGVPTAFFAQDKGMDRQDLRVAHGVDQGWHLSCDPTDPGSILAAVRQIADSSTAQSLRERLTQRPAQHGATNAALHWLDLISEHADAGIDRQAMRAAFALRREFLSGDRVDAPFAASARFGWTFRELAGDRDGVEEFLAATRLSAEPNAAARAMLATGAHLHAAAVDLAWDEREFFRFWRGYAGPHPKNHKALADRIANVIAEYRGRSALPDFTKLCTAAHTCVRPVELAAFLDQLLETADDRLADLATRLIELGDRGQFRSRTAAACWRTISSDPTETHEQE